MVTMTDLHESHTTATRRGVLMGAGVLGAGAVLTACGGKSSEPAASPSSSEQTSATASGSQVRVADVPVGGGVVLKDAKVVVTQPTAGQFHAFSAVCTHKQCLVSQVADGTIDCPCHGSRYSDVDGSVVKGPATQALATKTVTVQGDSLTVS
jgi:Rieske Fe-S protein